MARERDVVGETAVCDPNPKADLVLEGGGVKGIAHVGAIHYLMKDHDCSFKRVAGSSAGAVVAALVAAGVGPDRLKDLMSGGPGALDYRSVPQESVLDHLPGVGKPLSVLLDKGIYKGDHLRNWLHRTLAQETGAVTFGDLKFRDERRDLDGDRGYRLVVVVADVSRGQLVRLPWDCRRLYGLDPDRMSIADAVRASTSIPFFFRPFTLRWGDGKNVSYLVDGGTLSDFPIEIFDRTDGKPPRWPTFGIKLERRPPADAPLHRVTGTLSFAHALFETTVNGNDEVHLADPSVCSRTMFVDTSQFSSVNFDLSLPDALKLYEKGRETAKEFIGRWDWLRWKAEYGAAKGGLERARKARGEHDGGGAAPLAEAS
jgi:NTE family protein